MMALILLGGWTAASTAALSVMLRDDMPAVARVMSCLLVLASVDRARAALEALV